MNKFTKFVKKISNDAAITEAIIKAHAYIFEGINYPDNFDISKFADLPSFAARKRYADSTLKKLGAGSSRITYQIDDAHVLKLAKNQKGIAQNEAENDGYSQSMDSVAKIYEADDEGLWLVSDKVDNIRAAEFEQLTGMKFKDFCAALQDEDYRHKNGKRAGLVSDELLEEAYENELWHEMLSLIVDLDLIVGDLCRLGSYGKLGNRVVLRDAGFTMTVHKDHYAR